MAYMPDSTMGVAPVYTKNDLREVYASFNGGLTGVSDAVWDNTAATWLSWLSSGTKTIADLTAQLTRSYGAPTRAIPVPGTSPGVTATVNLSPMALIGLAVAGFTLFGGGRRS